MATYQSKQLVIRKAKERAIKKKKAEARAAKLKAAKQRAIKTKKAKALAAKQKAQAAKAKAKAEAEAKAKAATGQTSPGGATPQTNATAVGGLHVNPAELQAYYQKLGDSLTQEWNKTEGVTTTTSSPPPPQSTALTRGTVKDHRGDASA